MRLRQALQIANLEHLVETLPEGLNTRVGSGAWRSVEDNASAFSSPSRLQKSPIPVFDEAASALDAGNGRS